MSHTADLDYHFTCEAAPVQAEGSVDGYRFYFRAKYEEWTFSVAEQPGLDPVDIDSSGAAAGRGYFLSATYGSPRSSAASHMPIPEAQQLIEECVRRYRAERAA